MRVLYGPGPSGQFTIRAMGSRSTSLAGPEVGRPRSVDLALVGNDLAVVRQASRNDEIDGALELGEILQRRPDRRFEGVGRSRGLGRERHRVGLGLAGHDKAQALELGMAPPD